MRKELYTPDSARHYILLSSLVNSEAKLVSVASAIDTWGEEPFRPGVLHREVLRRQGMPPAWSVSYYLPFRFCQNLHNVVFDAGARQCNTPCRLLPGMGERAMAYCGLGMDWSLRYSHISLQQLLGRSAMGKPKQTPEMRVKLFGLLLQNPGRQRHIDLSNALGWHRKLLRDTTNTLASLGCLRYYPGYGPLEASAVELHPDFLEPIAGLCARFHHGQSPDLAAGAKLATEIINDEDSVRLLMAKVKRLSASANLRQAKGEEDLQTTLLRLIRELGEMCINQALAEAAIETGHTFHRQTIDTALLSLKDRGLLAVTLKSVPQNSNMPQYGSRNVLYYRLAGGEG